MAFAAKHHKLLVLLYLALAEILVFGAIVPRIGFYLDDWTMLAQLKFAGHSFNQFFQAAMHDPRVVVRPVEAVHFALMFALFGLKPLWYHICNGVLEVAAAWLIYLCVFEMWENKLFSLACAALFLLYPIHDSTHYWMVATSATLSMVFSLSSILASIAGAKHRRITSHALAFFLFALSIFNYECFLPLCALNVACVFEMESRRGGRPWQAAFANAAGFAAAIAAYFAWSRLIVPHICTAWVHAVKFSPANMMDTVVRGTTISLLPECWQFFAQQAGAGMMPLVWTQYAALIGLAASTCWLACALFSHQEKKPLLPLAAVIGIVAVAASFSIFGLNDEYQPTLRTCINRINYGSVVGVSLILSAGAFWLTGLLGRRSPALESIGTSSTLAVLLCFFTLTTWGMAKPWELSWVMQKHVADVLKQNAATIADADAVMLVNCPRYIDWSPVFDGVWDFERMARVVLNNEQIHADVVSERLTLDDQALTDTAHGFVCANFAFRNMVALLAPQSQVVKVGSAHRFVQLVKTEGMGFDLDKGTPDRWERTLIGARGNATF